MGHATHFLSRLERVDGPALDFALDLYREPGLLKGVLRRLNLSEGEQPVALPLEQGPEPPHAIVSRGGHFITCLAAGMQPTGAQIVSHALLRTAADERMNLRDLQAREGRAQIVFGRLHRAGPRLSREDFEDLRVIAALIPKRFVELVADSRKRIVDFRRHYRPREYERLDEARRGQLLDYWRLFWTAGHATLLAADAYAVEERFFPGIGMEALTSILLTGAHLGLIGLALRTCWAMARLGRHALPSLKDKLAEFAEVGARRAVDERKADLIRDAVTATLALPAIAARHTNLRAEIEKALLRQIPATVRAEAQANPDVDYRDVVLVEAGGNLVPELAYIGWSVLRQAPEFTGSHLAARHFAWRLLSVERPSAPPTAIEDVPEEVVRALPATLGIPLAQHDGHRNALHFIPAVARYGLTDHYLPAQTLDDLADLSVFNPKPEAIRAHLNEHHVGSGRGVPVIKPPAPGRNDACSCGSGQKYKKCCGR